MRVVDACRRFASRFCPFNALALHSSNVLLDGSPGFPVSKRCSCLSICMENAL